MTTEHSAAVIWDLDGTLADTEQAHFRAWNRILARYDRDLSWDEFKPTFGLGNQDILRMLISTDLTDEQIEQLSSEKEAMFRSESGGAVDAMPGARALALHLNKLGIPQAIGSSAPPENISFVLAVLEMAPIFQATVSRWEVPRGKPFPDIFQRAAEKLAVPYGQCVVLEDAPAGIQAAQAGGMRCIALAGTWPEEALHHADYVVRDLSTVLWERESWSAFATGQWNPSGD